MMADLVPIAADESFGFACSPEMSCFNACCRDLNQLLTPYDLLRLKNHLKLSSPDFLARYTARHTGPVSGLPIVTLKADDQGRCPFVTPQGCRVYENRPSSCRTYPLVRTISRSRQSGETTEHFMLLTEPHCRGFDHGTTQTVREYIQSQHAAVYNDINDGLMEIISLKNRLQPGRLNIQVGHHFYTALYDLDNFRGRILHRSLPQTINADITSLNAAIEDDLALLGLGMQWIKHVLLGL